MDGVSSPTVPRQRQSQSLSSSGTTECDGQGGKTEVHVGQDERRQSTATWPILYPRKPLTSALKRIGRDGLVDERPDTLFGAPAALGLAVLARRGQGTTCARCLWTKPGSLFADTVGEARPRSICPDPGCTPEAGVSPQIRVSGLSSGLSCPVSHPAWNMALRGPYRTLGEAHQRRPGVGASMGRAP